MSKVVMKRYDAYKDSGLEWLVEVPEHWKISHLKRFCTKITDGAHTSPDLSSNDYPFLTVVNLNNGILDFENCLFTSYIDYKKLVLNGCQPKKYDVLYSKDGTISETVVLDEDRNFVVGSSFIIVRPNLKMSNSFYLCYFLSSAIMRYQARIYVKGASLPRISIFNIAKLISIIPPLLEQQAIAAYLNTKTAQIDRKVDLLTQKATQYGKLKQSLINETVTRGLDKTVAMKDSGIEWIGEVPEHWEVKRFKEIFNKTHTGWTPDTNKRESFEGDNIWVTIKDMGNSHVYDSLNKLSDKAISEAGIPITPKGSLLFSFKLSIGKIAFSDCDLYTNEAIISIEDERNINLNYFYYTIPIFMILNAKENIYGAKLLNQSLIFNTSLLSPAKEEQKAIADYLDTKTVHIDRIVETINTQIEKLKELRKTLINDVVTGKIKVA